MVIKICSLNQNEGNLIEIFLIEIPSLILQINCDQVILLINMCTCTHIRTCENQLTNSMFA